MLNFIRVTMLWIVVLPYAFQFTGVGLNQLVIVANHDKFPVMINEDVRAAYKPDVNGMLDKEHCVMTSQTHLNMLADVFALGDWYSIGDGFIYLGEWLKTFCIFVWMALTIQKLKAATNERQTTCGSRTS